MKLSPIFGFSAAFALSATASHAAIIGVAGPNSSAGAAAVEISAPPSIIDDAPGAENLGQQGFNERQNVLLGSSINVDGGSVAAGTRVDSHMIFLNTAGNSPAVTHNGVVWSFSGTILGVMSDVGGTLEAASTAVLGAIGTTYPSAFGNRGFEGADSYSVSGNQLTVNMRVTEPGDWIRVITASEVPVPGALPLMLAGIAGLGGLSRRRRDAS